MPLDALKAQDAILRGRARAEKAFATFQQNWTKALILRQLKAMWMMMPPDKKEELKARDPEQYALVSRLFETTE